ncbi:hypothetical protein BR63_02025 [Thermanaerosceptrum fracticalcis]|uniref:2-isopropylmalate synthase/homocitrate synthase post-catalytic domain-containing protein n=1 Tax=Thermanaerosceptrum fracticalcis TaxID=1712410 RepID=A0A7G6DZE9_THEFR|nr:hypothetical protein [Thermanaerosceptrum fracticalcis]QNB45203.1 hypothetical protein BR63_02025 [Thermanaerosceptrum fracticalcis]
MPVKVGDHYSFIIDRTIPELLKTNGDITGRELQKFILILARSGVDYVEVNSSALAVLEYLPSTVSFIFRVEKPEDLYKYKGSRLPYCVMDSDLVQDKTLAKRFSRIKMKAIVEFEFTGPGDLQKLELINGCAGWRWVDAVRISGLSHAFLPEWHQAVEEVRKLKVKVDICPHNRYYLASSTALELTGKGDTIDFVTVAFSGMGGLYGFAALEELVMGLKVIKKVEIPGDTALFSHLSKLYQDLSKRCIKNNKAIIGSSIFKYESGIHADGIEKNPLTYEPFDPGMVGQARKLVLGKHSGSRSVISKLKELNLEIPEEYTSLILEWVRSSSAQLKREIYDYELARLCQRLTNGLPLI